MGRFGPSHYGAIQSTATWDFSVYLQYAGIQSISLWYYSVHDWMGLLSPLRYRALRPRHWGLPVHCNNWHYSVHDNAGLRLLYDIDSSAHYTIPEHSVNDSMVTGLVLLHHSVFVWWSIQPISSVGLFCSLQNEIIRHWTFGPFLHETFQSFTSGTIQSSSLFEIRQSITIWILSVHAKFGIGRSSTLFEGN